MQLRLLDRTVDVSQRIHVLRHALQEGSAWETSNAETLDAFIGAISKKKPFKHKRLGARAVRDAEALDAVGDVISEDECTLFRALAARPSYLSLDKPDCAFACNELCKEISRPNYYSILRSKRLVRYQVGVPRVVYSSDFEEPPPLQPLLTPTLISLAV